MDLHLDNKVAVVTGGSSGIGLATAKRLVAEGAFVFITGRRKDELAKAAAELGNNAVAVQGDVANEADMDRLYAEVKSSKGHVDVVFANAAVAETEPLGQIAASSIDKQFDVNIKGIVFTVQKALPLMGEGGSIILTSSIGAYKGAPGQSIYTASKAAIRALARSWAVELAPRRIRVNVVTPGGFDTPGARALFPDEAVRNAFIERVVAGVPVGRIGDPSELANTVAFLASDAASYVDGADFQIDGGWGQV